MKVAHVSRGCVRLGTWVCKPSPCGFAGVWDLEINMSFTPNIIFRSGSWRRVSKGFETGMYAQMRGDESQNDLQGAGCHTSPHEKHY